MKLEIEVDKTILIAAAGILALAVAGTVIGVQKSYFFSQEVSGGEEKIEKKTMRISEKMYVFKSKSALTEILEVKYDGRKNIDIGEKISRLSRRGEIASIDRGEVVTLKNLRGHWKYEDVQVVDVVWSGRSYYQSASALMGMSE